MQRIAMGLLLAFSFGCATTGGAGRDGVHDRPLAETWPEALRLVQEKGYEVTESIGETVVVTRWREESPSSKIAGRITRYTIQGEEEDGGRSRIRFFRHEGYQQDVIPANMTNWADTSGIEGRKQQQKDAAPGTTSRRFHARVQNDLQSDKTFQFKPRSVSMVRDHRIEAELDARLAGLPPTPAPADEVAEPIRPDEVKNAEDALSGSVCGAPVPGWSDVRPDQGTIIFGEVPGTNEVPKLVGQLACDALARGRGVLLLLELPANEQPLMDAFMDSDGGPAAREALLGGLFWARPYQDGRSSTAMLGLLEHARRLYASGFPLRVHAMDAPALNGPARAEAMAKQALHARAAAPGALMFALVGNLNAPALDEGEPSTFGSFLLAAKEPVIALTLAYSRGTAWTCDDPVKLKCGAHPMEATATHFRTWHWATPPGPGFHVRSPSIRRWQKRSQGLDGTFYIAELSAAGPALVIPSSSSR